MTSPYAWAPVLPAQVVDDAAVNALGAAVTLHGSQIVALQALSPVLGARQILSGAQASVTFLGIPATSRRAKVYWGARGDAAVTGQTLRIRINNDSGANYTMEQVQGTGATLVGAPSSGLTSGIAGVMPGASATAGIFGSGEIVFVGMDAPHSTNLGWTYTSQSMHTGNVANSGGGAYAGTGPFIRIDVLPESGNFVTGSDFQIEVW